MKFWTMVLLVEFAMLASACSDSGVSAEKAPLAQTANSTPETVNTQTPIDESNANETSQNQPNSENTGQFQIVNGPNTNQHSAVAPETQTVPFSTGSYSMENIGGYYAKKHQQRVHS